LYLSFIYKSIAYFEDIIAYSDISADNSFLPLMLREYINAYAVLAFSAIIDSYIIMCNNGLVAEQHKQHAIAQTA